MDLRVSSRAMNRIDNLKGVNVGVGIGADHIVIFRHTAPVVFLPTIMFEGILILVRTSTKLLLCFLSIWVACNDM